MAYGNSFYLIRLHKTGIFQTRLRSLERFLKALSSVNVFLSDEIIASGGCTILLRSFQRTVEMFLSIHCYATKVPDLVSLCMQWYVKIPFCQYLSNKTLRCWLYWQAMADLNNHVWVCGILLAHISLPNGLRELLGSESPRPGNQMQADLISFSLS